MRKPIEVRILLRGTLRETIRAVAKILKRTDRDLHQVYGSEIEYKNGEKIALLYRLYLQGMNHDDVFKLDAKCVGE